MTPYKIELPFRFQNGVRVKKWLHLAPSLNKKVHFRTKMIIKVFILKKLLIEHLGHPVFKEPVIHFKRCSPLQLDEADNLPASFKMIGDMLVKADFYEDDSPKYLKGKNFTAENVKVKHWSEAKIIIEIREKV